MAPNHRQDFTQYDLPVGSGGPWRWRSTASSSPWHHPGAIARAYATELRAILEYLGVSDVRMEQGSMRVDANISVAPPGERGKKVEIKNMNSLRSVYRALE